MNTHLQLQPWKQLLLLLLIPIAIVCFVIGQQIYRAVHPNTKPLRKRKRKKH